MTEAAQTAAESKGWTIAIFRDWNGRTVNGIVEAIHRDGSGLVTVALRLPDAFGPVRPDLVRVEIRLPGDVFGRRGSST